MSRLPTRDISYTYLAEDRAEFMQTYEMCRKSCPILFGGLNHIESTVWGQDILSFI